MSTEFQRFRARNKIEAVIHIYTRISGNQSDENNATPVQYMENVSQD